MLDSNRDGVLSRAEFQNLRESPVTGGEGPGTGTASTLSLCPWDKQASMGRGSTLSDMGLSGMVHGCGLDEEAYGVPSGASREACLAYSLSVDEIGAREGGMGEEERHALEGSGLLEHVRRAQEGVRDVVAGPVTSGNGLRSVSGNSTSSSSPYAAATAMRQWILEEAAASPGVSITPAIPLGAGYHEIVPHLFIGGRRLPTTLQTIDGGGAKSRLEISLVVGVGESEIEQGTSPQGVRICSISDAESGQIVFPLQVDPGQGTAAQLGFGVHCFHRRQGDLQRVKAALPVMEPCPNPNHNSNPNPTLNQGSFVGDRAMCKECGECGADLCGGRGQRHSGGGSISYIQVNWGAGVTLVVPYGVVHLMPPHDMCSIMCDIWHNEIISWCHVQCGRTPDMPREMLTTQSHSNFAYFKATPVVSFALLPCSPSHGAPPGCTRV